MTPAELARDGLAVYRLVRLVTRDELTRPLREKYLVPLLAEHGTAPTRRSTVAYGLACPWCLAVHATVLLHVLHRVRPQWGQAFAEAGAVAQLAGMLADRDRG